MTPTSSPSPKWTTTPSRPPIASIASHSPMAVQLTPNSRATADEDMRRSRMFPNRHYIQCVDESIGTDDNDSREAIAWAVYSSNDSYEAGERQRGPLPSTPSKAISPEGGIDDEDDTVARKAREYATIKAAMREMRRRYIGDKAHICKSFPLWFWVTTREAGVLCRC